ncbi:MAG: 30S ribosome-binding factor RbfA [Candidatus Nealsonbacteria bacterium]|nr:30S ribosome-binding factor RbfA [Candidatus Nealsonbacteria bacterium]
MNLRLQKINQLLRKEISQIILREMEFPPGVLATVTRAEASVDFYRAKIYISVIPEEQSHKIFRILNREIYHLQQILNKRLKIKIIPRIEFIKEEKTFQAGQIEEILGKLKKEEK